MMEAHTDGGATDPLTNGSTRKWRHQRKHQIEALKIESTRKWSGSFMETLTNGSTHKWKYSQMEELKNGSTKK